MKERRKGPIGRAADLAEGVAAAVRRMQREREPRVLVYDHSGYARLIQPDGARARPDARDRRGHGSARRGDDGASARPRRPAEPESEQQ